VTAFGLWDSMEMHESLAFCSFLLDMTAPTLFLFFLMIQVFGEKTKCTSSMFENFVISFEVFERVVLCRSDTW
jgi:hypothetical protein